MKATELPQDKIEEIASDLEGRSISIEDIIEVYQLPIEKDDREQLRFRLEEESGLEQCDLCGKWCPKEDLFETLLGKVCSDCSAFDYIEDNED